LYKEILQQIEGVRAEIGGVKSELAPLTKMKHQLQVMDSKQNILACHAGVEFEVYWPKDQNLASTPQIIEQNDDDSNNHLAQGQAPGEQTPTRL